MVTVGDNFGYSIDKLGVDLGDLRRQAQDPVLKDHFTELEGHLRSALSQPVASLNTEDQEELSGLIAEIATWKERLIGQSPESPFLPKELSQQYRDITYVAEGGFARVYRATTQQNHTVAVKVPKEMDRTMGDQFLSEINIWSKLDHKNVVKLLDRNIIPCPYLELEWVSGGTLREVPKPLPVADATSLVLKISAGLRHAHKQGIVHRDLTPSNVLLTSDNEPKITDWGLSQIRMASGIHTIVNGYNLLYAAPEQINRSSGVQDDKEKTDVYQLGSVFYELVTGKVPFDRNTVTEIEDAIKNDSPVPPGSVNPEARPVQEMILGCLEKDQSDRYSLNTLRDRLLDYLREEYRQQLDASTLDGNNREAKYYLCELVILTAQQNKANDCLKYLRDLQAYAKDSDLRASLGNIEEQLNLYERLTLEIDKDIIDTLDREVHLVKML